MVNTKNTDKLIAEIYEQVAERLDVPERERLTPFIKAYFATYPLEELEGRNPSDVYGATLNCWRFIQQLESDQPKIGIINPEYDTYGWQTPHTVIGILMHDAPFVVDSIRIELNRRGIAIYTIHSIQLHISRDAAGKLQRVFAGGEQTELPAGQQLSQEAMVFMEVTRRSDAGLLLELEDTFADILAEVQSTVTDYRAMCDKALQLAEQIEDSVEAAAFMRWLADDHFTFQGYTEYQVDSEQPRLDAAAIARNGLGLCHHNSAALCDDINYELQADDGADNALAPLYFSKSRLRSRVHRHAYPDYVTVRVEGDDGCYTEYRFLGLYTSAVYQMSPRRIPVLRDKISYVLEHSGLQMNSHDGKELTQILESFPRDELLQSTKEQLLQITTGIFKIQERRQVRLFVRSDHFGKFVNCLVYTPRDVYSTAVREKVEEILAIAFGAEDVEFNTYFSESLLTRTYFVFRVDPERQHDFSALDLQNQVATLAEPWSDLFNAALQKELGEEQAAAVSALYENAFPPGYRDDFEPRAAVHDIKKIAELVEPYDIAMNLYRLPEANNEQLRFRLFHLASPLALSDLLPVLENLGLRVLGERPYAIRRADGAAIFMHDFSVTYGLSKNIVLRDVRNDFQQAFHRVWKGEAESDAFNKLLLGSKLDWREIALLRAYAHYMKQIGVNLSEAYIAETLGRYLNVSDAIVDFFHCRFDPDLAATKEARKKSEQNILDLLDDVEQLNEDRVVRYYLALIKATVRTNFFQTDAEDNVKPYFSFKLQPRLIPDLPLPVPMFEVFVYSPRVEGVHLRGGKVARGGLRWSDRHEDFRTEVLGLVKAQQVKNSVIVPVGAKGGFVPKKLPQGGSREAMLEEGIACYKIFISALLDITDNIVDGEIVPPLRVLRKDEDDPYLVVAADKGTASFSDIANGLAAEYDFWLGDAFASGGSIGYDHKGMGITARGAWVSVQRHFRERDIDIQKTDFSVVGIGDMAGDVFGNGMLLSEHICLVGAFNHMHIFIDPNPDSAKTYAERKRLFGLSRSSWSDYNKELISAGGGIFLRSAKSIPINAEMRKRFAIEAHSLTPNELISALLRAPVDLLWNGGIGTYIKASRETHNDVGDKGNDAVRVDANTLRCQVLGEGGNLGVTQLARVEFALHGGACNTDFIDNAAGVDCSDHEVNIKILLNEVVANGDMTEKQRRKFLESMTDAVALLVLSNNYRQVQAISLAEADVQKRHREYRRLISNLEHSGYLNRSLEFLPSDDELVEREAQDKLLTRPELSVLMSCLKGSLKERLIDSDIAENAYMAQAVEWAFPTALQKKYKQQISQHRLHKEIIATQIANHMVNRMGITFLDRMTLSTGSGVSSIARAYVTACDIFSLDQHWEAIERLDHKVPAELQLRLMLQLKRLIRRASRWFLRNRRGELDPRVEIERFVPGVTVINASLEGLLGGHVLELFQRRKEKILKHAVPAELAHCIAGAPILYAGLGIVEAAYATETDVVDVAKVYFTLGEALHLHWFAQQISELKVESHWQAMAREAYRDDLEWQQSAITISALRNMQPDAALDVEQGIANWLEVNAEDMQQWQVMINEMRAMQSNDFAVYTVANRALLDFARRCSYSAES